MEFNESLVEDLGKICPYGCAEGLIRSHVLGFLSISSKNNILNSEPKGHKYINNFK